jgi:hypothetical protein
LCRLFQPNVVSARTLRADVSTKEHIGFPRSANSTWSNDFFFSIISDPAFGLNVGAWDNVDEAFSTHVDRLKKLISGLNKLRPKQVQPVSSICIRIRITNVVLQVHRDHGKSYWSAS